MMRLDGLSVHPIKAACPACHFAHGRVPVMAIMTSPLSTAEPWSLVAADYDELVLPLFTAFSRQAMEGMGLRAPRRVLDVACGPGTTTAVLAERGHEVDAIDFSRAMVERLEAKLGPGGSLHAGTVRAHVMDGQELRFAEASFDAAFSMFGLMFFPDRARGFAELYRVLRPGGQVCVSSWLPLAEVPTMRWAFGAFNSILPPPNGDAPTRAPVLEEPATFRRELEQAGFASVHIERCRAPTPVSDIDQFWQGMVRSSAPIALFREKVGEARWAELNVKALAQLHATAPQDLSSLCLEAWLGFGVKP